MAMDENELIKSILKKSKEKIAVFNYLEEDTNMRKQWKILKIVAMLVMTIGIMSGIVYATGTIIYNKIWKEPVKSVGFYSDEQKVIEEGNLMTEKEAREKINQTLKKFGHENEKVETVELSNNPSDYEVLWNAKTDNKTTIRIDAKSERYLTICFDSVLNKSVYKYRTTEEEAKETAKQLCEKFGYNLDEYNYTRIRSNLDSEQESYIWYVDFLKKYNDLVNPYEYISIGFIPEINEIYWFDVKEFEFENNQVEIKQDEARNIAIQEEQKITTEYNVKDIYCNLDIEKMNGVSYLRTSNYNQYKQQAYENYPQENYIEYRTNNVIRKIWAVTIVYDIPETVNRYADSFSINDEYFTYYIDATTGEIIGGSADYYTNRNN